jgi:predicted nucleic acid-binding Zn ribbon protein
MPIAKKQCKYCKSKMYGTDRREYCSDKCRQYAWREKKRKESELMELETIKAMTDAGVNVITYEDQLSMLGDAMKDMGNFRDENGFKVFQNKLIDNMELSKK